MFLLIKYNMEIIFKSLFNYYNIQVEALKPVKIATLAFQKQDLNLGDFFGIW